jgi:hypothetical protein
MKTKHLLCAAAIAALSAGAASATTLNIKITNTTGAGGFSITPLYTAFHDGRFDAFDVGEKATPGVEAIAETGNAMVVAGERRVIDPDSQGNVNPSPMGPPPIQPGEVVTTQLDIDGVNNRFFTYLAMLLPSNDAFIGNDNAKAYELFDAGGNFKGPLKIDVTGDDIYDAGTEANALLGSAFVQGEDIALGGPGEGVITAGTDLSVFAGATLATGDILGSGAILDFASNPSAFNVISIEITEAAAPIPLPASAPLLAGALALLGWRAKRKQS